jgi:hypothetical protein
VTPTVDCEKSPEDLINEEILAQQRCPHPTGVDERRTFNMAVRERQDSGTLGAVAIAMNIINRAGQGKVRRVTSAGCGLRSSILTFSLALSCAFAAHAHHSIAAIDLSRTLTLKGTVTEVWVNPHVFIFMDAVGSDGSVVAWSIPSGGDANVHHGRLRNITLPDGRTMAGPREFLTVPGRQDQLEGR